MNKILVRRLLEQPAAWPACARVIISMARGQKEAIVRRQGVRLLVNLGSGQGLYCAVAGTKYEPEMDYFLGQMKPGDTLIDVGANIGNFSLHAYRRIRPSGRVYSFEPLPETYETLQRNIQINRAQNIEAFKLALSDREGAFTMHVPSRNSSATLVHAQGSVATETLDGFCARHQLDNPRFIKVDIEGGELNFFRGGERILRESSPLILFESMHSAPAFLERSFLRKIGFSLYRLNGKAIEILAEDSKWKGNVFAEKL